MQTSEIILVMVILLLLSVLSFIIMKNSNKEYPPIYKEDLTPKFKPRKVTDLSKKTVDTKQIENSKTNKKNDKKSK
jgi:hypothetical protein